MAFNLDNYEEVKDRIPLFFEKYEDGRVYTEILSDTSERVVMRTSLYKNLDEQSQNCPLATGIAHEEPGGHIAKYYENCETSSYGRALANLDIKSDIAPRPSREEMVSTESMNENPNSSANRKPSSAPQNGNGGNQNIISDKQAEYLLSLGYDGSEGAVNALSKTRASELITELREKRNQRPKQGALQ